MLVFFRRVLIKKKIFKLLKYSKAQNNWALFLRMKIKNTFWWHTIGQQWNQVFQPNFKDLNKTFKKQTINYINATMCHNAFVLMGMR